MADDPRDDNRNGNVVSFRSRGGAPPGLPPIPGAPPPAPPAPPAEPPPPASGPEEGGGDGMVVPSRRRRSVADSLADLTPALPPAPGSTGTAGTVALRSEGTAPARQDGGDGEADGPGVAALGLAATLAIALAALRGTATALTDWRQRRQERAEELAPLREARLKHRLAGEEAAAKHALAMQSIGDKAAQQRSKSIPSSQDYGRKALGGGRGSLKGGGGKGPGGGPVGKGAGGTGPGRGGKGGSGSGLTPGGKKTSPKTSTGLGSLGAKGKGGGSKLPGSGKNGPSGKNGGSGSGIKSPSGGKSPSSKKSSPALERARGRQERAAARQDGKNQRRADRQAARRENRAKDRDAARDRKTRAADARQDTKDRVRNARADAKQARREQVRQDRFEAKQKARKARAKARRKKKETAAAADADRTTLGQAVAKAARRRLKKRRKNLSPPVLTTVKRKKSKKKGGKSGGSTPAGPKVDLTKKPKPGAAPKVDLTKKPKPAGGSATGAGPKVDLTKKPKPGGGAKASGPGRKKKVRVKSKSKKKTRGSASGTGPADRRKASRKERARRASERARAKAEDTSDSPGSGWEFYTPPPRGERRSAYDSMRDTDPQQQEVWVAEQVFPPGYQASSREPLTTGARGLPAGTGSPTTNTKEAPVGNSPAVPTGAVTTAMDDGMNPEHATEVTLDDVVDFLDEVVSEAFAAHDECLQLSAKAKELMYALDEVAARLAAKHNIIGTITAWAMRKLSESMEVLSRKAEEMSVKSLHAAETCETAKTELDDAYRPLTQATADAGLRTPSARVHNTN